MTTFVDTNVLLYAISTAEEEAEKRAIARRVLLRTDLAFSVQVLQEVLRSGYATRAREGWHRRSQFASSNGFEHEGDDEDKHD